MYKRWTRKNHRNSGERWYRGQYLCQLGGNFLFPPKLPAPFTVHTVYTGKQICTIKHDVLWLSCLNAYFWAYRGGHGLGSDTSPSLGNNWGDITDTVREAWHDTEHNTYDTSQSVDTSTLFKLPEPYFWGYFKVITVISQGILRYILNFFSICLVLCG